jgi:hypothetical protein
MPIDTALTTLIAAQNFSGVVSVCAGYLPEKKHTPAIVIECEGGDCNNDLAGDDDSLVFTNTTFRVRGNRPSIVSPIAQALKLFLADLLNEISLDREIFCCICEDPSDDPEPPPDAENDLFFGKLFSAVVQHGAA